MKKLMTIVLVLATCIVATAAPPTVEVPKEIKAKKGQFVTIAPVTNAKAVSWDTCSEYLSIFPSDQLVNKNNTVIIGLADGVFVLKGTAILDNEYTKFDVVVTVGSGVNPIPPTPVPPTPVPPTPVPPTPVPPTPVVYPDAWFVVVEETSVRTPQIAMALDFRVWDKYPINGQYRFYDKDSPSAKKFKYDALAVQAIDKASKETPPRVVTYPVLMAVDKNGNLIKAISLPFDSVQQSTFIYEITGKKS